MKLTFGLILGLFAAILALNTATAATISAKQSTLDEHQDACDSGQQAVSWHFVINQINSSSNAPATISVTWSNGDVEDVPLEKFTGKVGHYTVAGSDSHTSIVSATADIYDGWSGQFNLSSVECGPATPPLDACAPFEDRIVITFDPRPRLGNPAIAPLEEMSDPESISVPAGTYMVTLQSFDAHSTQIPSLDQMNEQWFAEFSNGTVVQSGIIGDLPEDQDTLNQQVGTVTFPSTMTQVVAVHALAGGPWPTPESIEPVCIALDPVR